MNLFDVALELTVDEARVMCGLLLHFEDLMFADSLWKSDCSVLYLSIRCHRWCASGAYMDRAKLL